MLSTAILFTGYFNQAMEFSSANEKFKDKIRQKFYESRNLPRKKKKRVRKELQLDWAIACWDPFQF